MIKIILVCLLLVLGLWGCDDNEMKPEPTPTPIVTPTPTPTPDCFPNIEVNAPLDWLVQFQECPTDGFVQICNTYFCNFFINIDNDLMPAVQRFTHPNSVCTAIDCFTAECDLFIDLDLAETGLFMITEILENSAIVGDALVDGEQFDYECVGIVP